jgi:hypothetical protein
MADIEQYPEAGATDSKGNKLVVNTESLLKIYSVTYNVPFYFLPYDFKMTESLNINWNQQSVYGRMDPIATFKNMGRTIQLSFKARQKIQDGTSDIAFTGDELLHSIDHLKKCLYPTYNQNQIMVSPPLFRFQYKNLINAGEEQFTISPTNGVLGFITAFSANFMTEPNKIYFPSDKKSFAYPKVFDISLTFTVLNENLVETQQFGMLKKKYFYNYEHIHTHGNATQANGTDSSAASGTPIQEEQEAAQQKVLEL